MDYLRWKIAAAIHFAIGRECAFGGRQSLRHPLSALSFAWIQLRMRNPVDASSQSSDHGAARYAAASAAASPSISIAYRPACAARGRSCG
jgi:hypothetical protein